MKINYYAEVLAPDIPKYLLNEYIFYLQSLEAKDKNGKPLYGDNNQTHLSKPNFARNQQLP